MNYSVFSITLLALMSPALGRAADQWSHAEPLTVIMVDNSFQPDHITFHAGQPYELRLENHGKDLHEFTAPAFLKAATIRDKKLLANGGTDIVVQPGQVGPRLADRPPKGPLRSDLRRSRLGRHGRQYHGGLDRPRPLNSARVDGIRNLTDALAVRDSLRRRRKRAAGRVREEQARQDPRPQNLGKVPEGEIRHQDQEHDQEGRQHHVQAVAGNVGK